MDTSLVLRLRSMDDGDCLTSVMPPGTSVEDVANGPVQLRRLPEALPVIHFEQPEKSKEGWIAYRDSVLAGISCEGPEGTTLWVGLWEGVANPESNSFAVVRRLFRESGFDVAQDGGSRWIAFCLQHTGGQVVPTPVHLIPADRDLLSRSRGRDELARRNVLIAGLGSVGSGITATLARAGVGGFFLADPSRLEAGNVVRHAAGLEHCGRLKTAVAESIVRASNPTASVVRIDDAVSGDSATVFAEAISKVHVVICATDNRESRLLLNRWSLQHHKPLVIGGLSMGAYSGMVFRVRPTETMCYHCFVSGFPEAAADRETLTSSYAALPDPHLQMDIEPVTNMMTRLVLDTLLLQHGSGSERAELEAAWFLWVNRREEEYREWQSLSDEGTGPTVLRWYPIGAKANDGCPHCGTVRLGG